MTLVENHISQCSICKRWRPTRRPADPETYRCPDCKHSGYGWSGWRPTSHQTNPFAGWLRGRCSTCGTTIDYTRRPNDHPGPYSSYCSVHCKWQAHGTAGTWHDYQHLATTVFERDDYRCHLCGEFTDPTLPTNHPWEPTIDHLVPQSDPGCTHDLGNLACAHRVCNQSRGDAPLPPPPVALAGAGR